MVKLYVADISNLPDPLLVPDELKKLPMERQQRIHNMQQEKSRKQSMGVGLLLQKVLALYHMQDSQVYTGEHGKPMIEGLEFSLAHSGNLVVCAVSNKPVGCDVERLCEAPKGVAKRYFSEGEQAYLSQFSEVEYDREFFKLWTMKESYAKMTGEGMAQTLGTFEVVVGEGARVCRYGELQDCFLQDLVLEGYLVSVCGKEAMGTEEMATEVIWVTLT